MTKVVGFDLDDTLIPEVQFLMSGSHYIAKWLHEKHPDLPEYRILATMRTAIMNRQNHYSALERLLEEYNLKECIDMKEVVAEFRNHQPDPTIYHFPPSVIELLETLKHNTEIRTVLITDGRRVTQRNKIKAADLQRYFADSDIYISEETGHDKTDPDTFLRVMEKYAGATEFYYIGDNPNKDFLHPSRLGWITHPTHPFPLMIHQPQGMPR